MTGWPELRDLFLVSHILFIPSILSGFLRFPDDKVVRHRIALTLPIAPHSVTSAARQ